MDENNTCPICLGEDVKVDDGSGKGNGDDDDETTTMVEGSCRHPCCLPCMQRVLSAPNPGYQPPPLSSSNPTSSSIFFASSKKELMPSEDASLQVPTRGRCPMCRSHVNLFDLMTKKKKRQQQQQEEEETLLRVPAIAKNHNIVETDLKGRIFVKNRQGVGYESIHFPETEGDLPWIDFGKITRKNIIPKSLTKIYFEPDCHFHEQTRTFHGRIRIPTTTTTNHNNNNHNSCCHDNKDDSPLPPHEEWECVMAFSSDYRFIARGIWVHAKKVCSATTSCSQISCKFPLDGKWTVSWPTITTTTSNSETKRTFLVHGNRFQKELANSISSLESQDDIIGRIEFETNTNKDDPNQQKQLQQVQAKLIWHEEFGPEHVITRDFLQQPVRVGDSIEWTNIGTRCSKMIWTRESIGTSYLSDDNNNNNVPLEVVPLGSDHPDKIYYHELLPTDKNNINGGSEGRLSDQQQTREPEYNKDTIWGNVFGQGLSVGIASYHFLKDESGAYISYEHEDTSMWPPLDNGSPVPSRMWFTEVSFDAENRIFRGKIDWDGTHNTTWQGCRWWRYEMKFSKNYTCIIGGFVNSVPLGSTVEMDMSKFGNELIYINIGLLEKAKKDFDVNSRAYSMHMATQVQAMSEELAEDDGSEESAYAIIRLSTVFMTSQRHATSFPRSYE